MPANASAVLSSLQQLFDSLVRHPGRCEAAGPNIHHHRALDLKPPQGGRGRTHGCSGRASRMTTSCLGRKFRISEESAMNERALNGNKKIVPFAPAKEGQ